ncbi:phage distal tail protein [Nonomuraea sediminis]|uniref:phage distal tail protein n=1 Tax=Nonomuraea sediminis TaxID=2835864 RepID=UPI001BDCBE47|nr:phage tail domain-containing protein [Nonomuraea sediminis]
MARLGRSQPIPVTVRGRLTYTLVDLTLPAFESVSEWPTVTVTSPDVNLNLGPFESVSEWPALSFTIDRNLTLPPFESISEWPALTVSVPVKPGDALTGADGEIDFNGTLWGPSTSYKVQIPVEGWLGLPSVDNLNVERPTWHGAWDARKLAQQRIVTLRIQVDSATDPSDVETLLRQVIAVTGLQDDETPLPLVVKGYGPPSLAMGQVVDRRLDMDGDYNAGLPTAMVLVACADPRRYGLDLRGVTVPVNSPIALANPGNTAAHPFIRLEGPVTNPVLTNQRLNRTLQFNLTVADGEALEIDTFYSTATINGVSKMSTLTGTFVPVHDFVLSAGADTISYTATSGGSQGVDFIWRDATI